MKLLACFLSFSVVLVVIVALFGLLGYQGYTALEANGYGKLGALFASLAIVMKLEFILLFLGAVFVIETLCVMLQIFWVKVF